jgi:mannose-6-phosphate isomerase-like protein (cupin superfamily)
MTLTSISDLAGAEGARSFIGAEQGDVPISMFLIDSPPGEGPRLHRHPYPEVFVLHTGAATFVLDDREVTASGGEIVVAPAEVPHRFRSVGAERLRLTAIHTAARMETEWLEPVS